MSNRKRYDKNRDIRRSIPQKEIIISSEISNESSSKTNLPDLNIPNNFSDISNDRTSYETTSTGDFYIPGFLPDEKSRSVNYVPIYLVNDLVQKTNDQTLFSNSFFTLIGSLFGLILSWTTFETPIKTPPMSSIIASILILLFSGLVFWFMKRAKILADEKMDEINKLYMN